MWAERIVHSAIADQLIEDGLASRSDLEEISTAWRAWAAEPSGWISVLHGEVLIRVG
jgi:hypothetical protein